MIWQNLLEKAKTAIATQKIQELTFGEEELRQQAALHGWKMSITPAKKGKKGVWEDKKLSLADKYGSEFVLKIGQSYEEYPMLTIHWDWFVEESRLIVRPVSYGFGSWYWSNEGKEFLKVIMKHFGLTQICVATETLVQLPCPDYVTTMCADWSQAAWSETPWMEISEAEAALMEYHKLALEKISEVKK